MAVRRRQDERRLRGTDVEPVLRADQYPSGVGHRREVTSGLGARIGRHLAAGDERGSSFELPVKRFGKERGARLAGKREGAAPATSSTTETRSGSKTEACTPAWRGQAST